MNKEILIDKVSRLLGVSATEKEFAFQIFIEKTADVLNFNQALKYPGLGFFYIKEDNEDKTGSMDTLLYVPIQDNIDPLEDNFFLSFDVQKKNRDLSEFDSSVFSLSIEKSTLPFEKDSGNNVDISYHLLKKTIEERVEDLISTAVQLENFNISDSLLSGKTADESFNLENFQNQILDNSNSSYEEMIFSRMNLEESLSSFKEEDIIENNPIPENDEADYALDSGNKSNIQVDFKESREENIIDLNEADDFIEDNKYFESIREEKIDFQAPEAKEEVEWKWGDDLTLEVEEIRRDEGIEEEFITRLPEPETSETENENQSENLFAELENALSQEKNPEVKTVEELKENSFNDIQPVNEETNIKMMEEAMKEENENTPPEDTNYNSEDEGISKRNIILIGSLILIVAIAIYIIFFNGLGIIKKKSPPPQIKPDSSIVKETASQDSSANLKNPLVSQGANENKSKAVSGKAKDLRDEKTQKLKESQAGDLLREIKNESKVGSNIFTDGKSFYVQVSSWKNISKAEQEVKKLKAKGVNAFMVKAYIEEFKGTWYRVRIAGFKTREEAEAYSKKNRY